MTCFFCKGNMREDVTTYFQELDNTIVIIRRVPCFKCPKCGEVAYSAAVAERIGQIVGQFEKALTEIAVVNYSAA